MGAHPGSTLGVYGLPRLGSDISVLDLARACSSVSLRGCSLWLFVVSVRLATLGIGQCSNPNADDDERAEKDTAMCMKRMPWMIDRRIRAEDDQHLSPRA